jgi:hypothetical protein
MIESALEGVREPTTKAIVDGTELEGWDLRAAWDDFRIGLKHGSQFEKIAMYGNRGWQETAKVCGWFISGEVKYFADSEDVLEWLRGE